MPTLSGLRTIVRRDVLLSSTDVIDDTALNALLNEGAVQFAKDGQPFIKTVTWNTAASTSEYVLSGSSLKAAGFLEVYWPTGGILYTQESGSIKLPPHDFTVVSEAWLNRELPAWKALSASDTLQHVYLGYNSNGYLVLGTVPAASTTTPEFKLWYVSRGTDMSADANYPYTNDTTQLVHIEPYLKAIAYWAAYVLHRDYTKLTEEADRYLALYNSIADECKEAQRRVVAAEVVGLTQDGMMGTIQTFGSL